MLRHFPLQLWRPLCFLLAGLVLLFTSSSCASTIDPTTPLKVIFEKDIEQLSPLETVTIDSREYPIPEAWLGQILEIPPLSSPPLVMVPREFVKDQGRIFLLPDARDAFQQMAEAAKEAGLTMVIDSGYRSLRYQKQVYRKLMAEGRSFEDVARYVAPPGYSEHMLGLAVDFVPSNWRFVDSPVYRWLLENGAQFGFYESYPEINSNRNPWEPSHWRFRPHIRARLKIRKIQ